MNNPFDIIFYISKSWSMGPNIYTHKYMGSKLLTTLPADDLAPDDR